MLEDKSLDKILNDWKQNFCIELTEPLAGLSSPLEVERLQKNISAREMVFSKNMLQPETDAMNQRAELQCDIQNITLKIKHPCPPVSIAAINSLALKPENDNDRPMLVIPDSAFSDLMRLYVLQQQQREKIPAVENTISSHPEIQNKFETRVQVLDDTEARFTELHEHVMALHRKIEDQEEGLIQQSQLLQQQLDQIQQLENRILMMGDVPHKANLAGSPDGA